MTVTATYKCEHTSKFSGPTEVEYAERAKEQYCTGCDIFYQANGIYPIIDCDLTLLEGSEKQVTWANDIRNQMIERVHTRIKQAVHHKIGVEDLTRTKITFIAVINQQTQARWWIDHRDDGLKAFASVYEQAYKEVQ